jgi:hypothetical protein
MADGLSPLFSSLDLNADALARFAGDIDLIGEVPGNCRSIEADERRAIRGEECTDVRGNLARSHAYLGQKAFD